ESRSLLQRSGVRYWIGASYLKRQMPEDALAQFQHALQLDPEDTRSLLGAAHAYLDMRHPAEALGLARRIIAIEPINADAYFLSGRAARALDASTEAAAFFERAAALHPQTRAFRKEPNAAAG